MTTPENTLSDVPLILQYFALSQGVGDLGVKTANKVEKLLCHGALPGDPESYRGYSVGTGVRNFSRKSPRHTSLDTWGVRDPGNYVDFLQGQSSLDDNIRVRLDELMGLSINSQTNRPFHDSIQQLCLARIQRLVGAVTPDIIYSRRLLDHPEIVHMMVRVCAHHDQVQLEKLLEGSPYVFGQQQFPHTRNLATHQQAATGDSYIARAFGTQDLPPVRKRKNAIPDRNKREQMIQSIPIDPEKISDEIFIKLGLAPADFETFTPAARTRYKLIRRKDFLGIFAQGETALRMTENGLRRTARIMHLTLKDGEKRIAIFRTTTDKHIHVTGKEKPQKRYHKISQTVCSVFLSREEALESQKHAIEGLKIRLGECTFLHETFTHVETMDELLYKSFIAESVEILAGKENFYAKKLLNLITQLINFPARAIIKKNIISTLEKAIEDTNGKIEEISQTARLLATLQ